LSYRVLIYQAFILSEKSNRVDSVSEIFDEHDRQQLLHSRGWRREGTAAVVSAGTTK
jgi:hypothetical protein